MTHQVNLHCYATYIYTVICHKYARTMNDSSHRDNYVRTYIIDFLYLFAKKISLICQQLCREVILSGSSTVVASS